MEVGCRFFQPIRTVQYFKSCYLRPLISMIRRNSTGLGPVGRSPGPQPARSDRIASPTSKSADRVLRSSSRPRVTVHASAFDGCYTPTRRCVPLTPARRGYAPRTSAIRCSDVVPARRISRITESTLCRAARPVLQIATAPTAAMVVAIVQSGRDRVAVTTKTNVAHSAATAQAVDKVHLQDEPSSPRNTTAARGPTA